MVLELSNHKIFIPILCLYALLENLTNDAIA